MAGTALRGHGIGIFRDVSGRSWACAPGLHFKAMKKAGAHDPKVVVRPPVTVGLGPRIGALARLVVFRVPSSSGSTSRTKRGHEAPSVQKISPVRS